MPEAVPVTLPVNGPENPVAVSKPVDGLKDNFVSDVFCGRFPVFAVTHVGYIVALVVVSFVIAVFVALVAVVAEVALVAVEAFPVNAPTNVVAFTTPVVPPIVRSPAEFSVNEA